MRHTIVSFIREALGRRRLLAGSALVATATAASYVLGLLRDRLLAQNFGATGTLDAYNAAFLAPDLILNIFVASALTAAFVPIFSQLNDKADERNQFTNSVLNSSIIVVLIAGILVYITAPLLSHLIVPGFDEVSRGLFIKLMRLLLLSPIIFAISNTLGSILVTQERFTWYSLAAVFYNAGTICGILFLSPQHGIYGVAWGTLGGAVIHLLARLIGMRGLNYSWQPTVRFDPSWRKFLRLMVPKMIGHPVEQLTMLGFTAIASGISAGSVAILNFAHNFQSMPINMIGVTFAVTAFPAIAKAAAQNDEGEFKNHLRFVSFMILGGSALAAAILFFFAHPIIEILLGGGQFDATAISDTAMMLAIFALSIPTESWSHILARGFYSLQNSVTPVVFSIVHLIIAISIGKIFSNSVGISALGFGFLLGSFIKTIAMAALIQNDAERWFRQNKKPATESATGQSSAELV